MPLPSPISRNKSIAPQPQPREALPENTPLEFHVLLSACRLFLGTEEPAALEALLKEGPDWGRLTTLANRHGVMPLLYRSLGRVDRELVPQETMARLRVMYMHNAARNIRMTGELLRILDAFKDAGIRAVPLKGPVLAEQLYGDVALRQFSDLDILIAQENLEKAIEITSTMGYKCEEELKGKRKTAFLNSMHHYHLYNERLRQFVELHWKSSPNHYGLRMDVLSILSRAVETTFFGKKILNISNEDQIVFLCLHGAKHAWQQVSWICDVAKAISSGKVDWLRAIEVAHESKNERLLILGPSLAKEIFGIAIPQEITRLALKNNALHNFNRNSINNLALEERNQSVFSRVVGEQVVYLDILDGPIEKSSFITKLIFKPVNEDFDSIRLPEALFPLYYLVRPVRLIATYGKALCKHYLKTIKSKSMILINL